MKKKGDKSKSKVKTLKTKRVVKSCINNRFNQTKTAKELGVTPQAISKRLKTPEAQSILDEFLNSEALEQTLVKVAQKGLNSQRRYFDEKKGKYVLEFDPHTTHKYWKDLMTAKGKMINKVEVRKVMLTDDERKEKIDRIKQMLTPSEN